jgi:radical S-adenosyl methionine domain-containing protein 2
MEQKKISISGLAGSGKSTVGKLLAKRLNYNFESIGNYSRDLALREFGMTINEFQEYCKAHPEMDKKIDDYFIQNCSLKSNLIIDYRLAFHFLNDCFHVFLTVSDEVAAYRIQQANDRTSEKEGNADIAMMIKKRNATMRDRFSQIYNADFADQKNYHLVLNTDKLTPDELVERIIEKLTPCTSSK